MKEKQALQTTLDRLPWGDSELSDDLKVSNKLPEGVKSKELYNNNSSHLSLEKSISILVGCK